ncbi:IS630 family transposase, partial [Streptomyces galbus]
IWRAFGLQPHRSQTFKLSTDPYFVDKVHDVVPDVAVGDQADRKTEERFVDVVAPFPADA